jgi:hypothetical protein
LITHITGQDHFLSGDFFLHLKSSTCGLSHLLVFALYNTLLTVEKRRERRLMPSKRWQISLMVMWMWSACGSGSTLPQVTVFPQQGEPVHVSVEIANTEEKRQMGLMYRTDLPEMQGMLFLFPREGLLSFWMKNTPRSLDIIYINSAHTIVSIARNTTPFSEVNLPSGKPAQFALEVNGGFCQRHGINEGDRIEFPKELPPVR